MEKQYFYNTPSARMLEFDRIIGRLEEMAYTEKAKEMIRELAPGLSEAEVKAQLKNTTEARTMLENCGMPPITALEGITELLEMAGKGICLTAEQLEKIASTLTAVKRPYQESAGALFRFPPNVLDRYSQLSSVAAACWQGARSYLLPVKKETTAPSHPPCRNLLIGTGALRYRPPRCL